MDKNGIILIDKEEGYTSRECVNIANKIFNTKKIGHCGTLDPFATGLLILGVNKGTKLMQFIEADTKEYIATIKLFSLTDTLDKDGTIIAKEEPRKFDSNSIRNTLNRFLGKQCQIPPMYSAIKVDGKKLYEYAREGKEIKVEPRNIEIFSLDLINYNDLTNEITFITKVSKGTYIRTLGLDIAKDLGTIGYLNQLRRVKIGNYSVSNAYRIKEIKEDNIIDYNLVLDNSDIYGMLTLNEKEVRDIKNGKPLIYSSTFKEIIIKDYNNNLIAIYESSNETYYTCKRGLF